MSYVYKLYITQLILDFEGDVYFPEIKEAEWKEISKEKGLKNDENPYDYVYITYDRK